MKYQRHIPLSHRSPLTGERNNSARHEPQSLVGSDHAANLEALVLRERYDTARKYNRNPDYRGNFKQTLRDHRGGICRYNRSER